MNIKHIAILLLSFVVYTICPGQGFIGLEYTPTKSETVDFELIEELSQSQMELHSQAIKQANKVYLGHIDKILSYIPSDIPNGKAIAEKYINRYHEVINYPDAPYGMLHENAKAFIRLVKYDIEEDIRDSKNKSTIYNINSSQALFRSGYNKQLLDKHISAINDFTTSIDLNNDNGQAYLYRGISKIHIGEITNAIKDINKAIALKADESETFYWRAYAKSKLKDYKGAIMDYQKAIEIYQIDAQSWVQLAFCKLQLKDYANAMNDVNTAISIDHNNITDAYGVRGEINYQLKKFTEAIADFDKSIELHPNSQNSFYFRGLSKFQLNKKEEGCMDLSKAGELGEEKAYVAIQKNCN